MYETIYWVVFGCTVLSLSFSYMYLDAHRAKRNPKMSVVLKIKIVKKNYSLFILFSFIFRVISILNVWNIGDWSLM